jgi:hypothetical protein
MEDEEQEAQSLQERVIARLDPVFAHLRQEKWRDDAATICVHLGRSEVEAILTLRVAWDRYKELAAVVERATQAYDEETTDTRRKSALARELGLTKRDGTRGKSRDDWSLVEDYLLLSGQENCLVMRSLPLKPKPRTHLTNLDALVHLASEAGFKKPLSLLRRLESARTELARRGELREKFELPDKTTLPARGLSQK